MAVTLKMLKGNIRNTYLVQGLEVKLLFSQLIENLFIGARVLVYKIHTFYILKHGLFFN